MLNFFPDLLVYGLLAPFIIRVWIGFVFIFFGVATLTSKRDVLTTKLKSHKYPLAQLIPWILGIVEMIAGGFLVVGFMTQITALVIAYVALNLLIIDIGKKKIFGQSNLSYIAIMIISLSLLFSGAGFLAIDLPL